jgi:hypothetical protein
VPELTSCAAAVPGPGREVGGTPSSAHQVDAHRGEVRAPSPKRVGYGDRDGRLGTRARSVADESDRPTCAQNATFAPDEHRLPMPAG